MSNEALYHKIPITSPGLYLFKRLFRWAYFHGRLFSEGLIIGGNFTFQNGLDLTVKTAYYNKNNKPYTADLNSPWAYIREGLFSEGFIFFLGGGAYYGILRVYNLCNREVDVLLTFSR